MVLMDEHTTPPGASLQGVGRGRSQRILAKSIKIKEKILSVNYNNSSPTMAIIAKMAFIAVIRPP